MSRRTHMVVWLSLAFLTLALGLALSVPRVLAGAPPDGTLLTNRFAPSDTLSGATVGHRSEGLIARSGQSRISASLPLTECTGWEVVTSPNVVTATAHYLYRAEAVSANDVWAVGYFVNPSGVFRNLAEHWDGSSWSIISTPDFGTSHNALYTVSTLGANDVWAFGDYRPNTSIVNALALHWDGSTWISSTITSPSATLNTLRGSAALAPDDIWVTGSGTISGTTQPIIEHWNGSDWSLVSAALTGTNPGLLRATAFAPNDVWAVGGTCLFVNCPGGGQPLIEHWDGSTWSISPSQDPGAAYSFLVGISGTSSNDIWAVGNICSDTDCTQEQTLIEHWDGSTWTIMPSPNPGSFDTNLSAVLAVAPDDAWATGSATNDGTIWFDPMFHWDGSTWTNVDITSPGLEDNDLRGFAMVSPTDIWAVGDIDNGTGELTQIQHFTGPCAPATPTVTGTPTAIASTSTPVAGSPTSTAVVGTPTSTATPCSITFSDVNTTDYFYEAVRYLYCNGVISGYSDGSFRPYNNTTRGQMAKIVALGFALPIWTPSPSATPSFSDVPRGSTFFDYVETAAHSDIVSGYADGTYRPNNNVTRGQLSKIIVNGAVIVNGWVLVNPTTPTFSDVASDSTFYQYIETAYCHQIISGYSDNTFRPGNNATRGQISKIQYLAILDQSTCSGTPATGTPAPSR